jgi:hypothetical protein
VAEDYHCCSHRVLISWFALLEMVAGRLGSSGGTHCWAQECWVVAMGAGSDGGGVVGRGWLAVYWFLEVWGVSGNF